MTNYNTASAPEAKLALGIVDLLRSPVCWVRDRRAVNAAKRVLDTGRQIGFAEIGACEYVIAGYEPDGTFIVTHGIEDNPYDTYYRRIVIGIDEDGLEITRVEATESFCDHRDYGGDPWTFRTGVGQKNTMPLRGVISVLNKAHRELQKQE